MDHQASEESTESSTIFPQESGDNKTLKEPDVQPIAEVVDTYLHSIRSIGQTAQLVLPHVSKWLIDEIRKAEEKIARYAPGFPEIESSLTIALESAREFAELTSTLREIQELRRNKAPSVLARSLFLQMFSEFDAYTGALLKLIYLKNDDLLKGISREISLSDLLQHEDLASVKCAMLDKEIETFRRDSYVEQFTTLEKKFGLPLRKFKEWGEFVELSQRRNIFTHNGGAVSDQYLVVCEREGHVFSERPSLGDSLSINVDYFNRALRLLSLVGMMLGYTLWSKVFPKESEEFHSSLNNTLYHCLQQKRWLFVAELQDFVLSDPMRRNISEVNHRIRIVNVAIGLKFSNRSAEALRLLRSMDWTASYRDFKLAILVLEEKYDEAIAMMESIGKSGEIIRQPDYHTWPLFTKLRERPEFYAAYHKIYGESFSHEMTANSETSIKSTHPIAPNISKRNKGNAEAIDVEVKDPSTHQQIKNRKRRTGLASTTRAKSPAPKIAKPKKISTDKDSSIKKRDIASIKPGKSK